MTCVSPMNFIVNNVLLVSSIFLTLNLNTTSAKKHNILFILTDDQDLLLGQEKNGDAYSKLGAIDEVMPTVKNRILKKGAFFNNFFINTPICCPSRTEFFTGRYFHNLVHEHENEEDICMHANTTRVALKDKGMFGLLTAAGYNTGIFGKVTNNQKWILDELVEHDSVSFIDSPLEYNDFNTQHYYRFDKTTGKIEIEELNQRNPKYGTTYQTAQIGNRTLHWLEQAAKLSRDNEVPFFAYMGFHAPHFPADPAPWHQDLLPNIRIPKTPNYNISSPDKSQHIRQNAGLSERAYCWQNIHFRDRWLSLLSVDDSIKEILDKLEMLDVLDETYVIFTSDHGYKQGQWRIGTSKQHPYETDIRVPFIIKGPGISHGMIMEQVTGNVDVLPTVLSFASSENTVQFIPDGKSMMPLLVSGLGAAEKWGRDRYLTEYMSCGTYFNDHSNAWNKGQYRKNCGGPMPNSPYGTLSPEKCVESEGVGDGNCYLVDSVHSNTWRALRVINSTHNIQYIEYDPAWKFLEGAELQHYELYDLNKDPFQLKNIYNDVRTITRDSLHSELLIILLVVADLVILEGEMMGIAIPDSYFQGVDTQ
eukprot:CAMPEP_0204864468 /NCGR_PEP_ID=MMETSP1348-20121228/4082_1 /ASSEMBLY_ACC=CAM_ASM_000700 /TAXON_ID=215587 /ORGANISM="Aplanochytrium stocchinoi, Strain GSBS06" /LENGTH=589 /DNA_ID=CAMNT_0052015113 /DNA_START=333 /DNA_END=2103 /DNA_ORIENTATION=-